MRGQWPGPIVSAADMSTSRIAGILERQDRAFGGAERTASGSFRATAIMMAIPSRTEEGGYM